MTTAKFIQQNDLVKALVVYKGITTDDGDPGGTYLVCSNLIGADDYLTNKMIVLQNGLSAFEDTAIVGFDNTTGEIDVSPSFNNQVLRGTIFMIVSVMSPRAGIVVPPPTSISPVDFWTPVKNGFAVGIVATTIMLGSITVVIPGTASIQKAVAMLKYRAIGDSSGVDNYISGAQEIQLNNGSLVNAIDLVDVQCFVPASSRDGGDVVIGSIDLSGVISVGSNSYPMQWTDSLAFGSSINFYDVQAGIRVWW